MVTTPPRPKRPEHEVNRIRIDGEDKETIAEEEEAAEEAAEEAEVEEEIDEEPEIEDDV